MSLTADEWNDKQQIGTVVRYWPGTREGAGARSITRSEAWVLGGHTPVVMVEGYAGGIALDHVEVEPTHVLVKSEPDGDDYEAKVECPGVTDSCRTWWECPKCKDLTDDQTDALWENAEAHGEEHQWIDGVWMVPSANDCLAAHMDTDAWEVAKPLDPGRHPVDLEAEEGFVYVRLIKGAARHDLIGDHA